MSMNISVHRVNAVMVFSVVFNLFCLQNIPFEEELSNKTNFYLKRNYCWKYFFCTRSEQVFSKPNKGWWLWKKATLKLRWCYLLDEHFSFFKSWRIFGRFNKLLQVFVKYFASVQEVKGNRNITDIVQEFLIS